MPEQTIKHDNVIPGFLLVLVPMAFLAVFLSVAWPFIMGATLLFTGNSVWQSYQLAKLSQQVNPFFNQLIVEKQGEISSVDLSARAKISGQLANRYLYSKAVKFGGTSHRSDDQGVVYNFLTGSALENVFTGINPNPTVAQKLAELDETPSVSLFQTLPTAVIEAPATPLVESVTEQATDLPTAETVVSETSKITEPLPVVASEPIPAETTAIEVAVEPPVAAVLNAVVTEAPATDVPPAVPVVESVSVQPETSPVIVEAQPPVIPAPEIAAVQIPKTVEAPAVAVPEPASSFTQALRSIFNAEADNAPEEVVEKTVDVSEVTQETISQADLAKRLDVHASTIYKRRTDVSFAEWTRSRDPEGIAWGYARDTKEFYRIG